MRDLSELKINDGSGQPVEREPPSSAAVLAFERMFGHRIPEPLLALLRFSNGGHPEIDSFNPSGVEDTNSFAINTFYFLADDQQAPYGLWEAVRIWRPYIGDAGLPFAGDGGGNIVFLDLASESPAVKVCWHDENFLIGWMAPSLEDFIDGLCENPDYI